jgi:hypothetical protein
LLRSNRLPNIWGPRLWSRAGGKSPPRQILRLESMVLPPPELHQEALGPDHIVGNIAKPAIS